MIPKCDVFSREIIFRKDIQAASSGGHIGGAAQPAVLREKDTHPFTGWLNGYQDSYHQSQDKKDCCQ